MEAEVRRTRPRKGSVRAKRPDIAKRVSAFYKEDMQNRDWDILARIQRYAKYRMWTESEGGPWPDSSDTGVSDMMEKSLRLQDTLSNAVLAQRPTIVSLAVKRTDQPKETTVDNLLDYQFFEEAPGEKLVGDLADVFINDGVFTVFVPWVKETKKQSDVRVLVPIPQDMFPPDFFQAIIKAMFADKATVSGKGDEPWDFDIELPNDNEPDKPRKLSMSFYTRDDGRCEVVMKGDVIIYDAPLPRIIPYDDVGHPVRCENLQPPGPSNPRGAAHCWIRDYPGKDEIKRLQKSGYYDLMTKKEVDELKGYARTDTDAREEKLKDDLDGKSQPSGTASDPGAASHDTLTRLICFDRYDVDGDGLDEDVIIWYLVEPDVVVKMAVLQEMYPTLRPDRPRPFAEASLFPVIGRRTGISLLEILEGMHDTIKVLMDQCIDSNTISITPFGFYRPTSTMQSETIRLSPGELYPLSDPARDVNFPNIGNAQAQGMAINLMTMVGQMEERAAVIGDFQLGRVPAGRATALRTVGAINALSGQGEARPERILRRFFTGIANIFGIMHDENQHFLPKRKQIRIQGIARKGQDPYTDIADTSSIHGQFHFKFVANAFNTSKQQLQQTLQTLLGTFINAMTMQMGVVRPENVYSLMRDFSVAFGVDPVEKGYITEPFPGFGKMSLMAEEAIAEIIDSGQMPDGRPAEAGGWQEHLARILEMEEDLMDDATDTGEISPGQGQMIQAYKAMVGQRIKEEAQQQQMAANAQQFAQQQGGGQQPGGRPAEQPPPDANSNAQVSSGGELLDETLPGAKGAVA